MVLYQIMLDFHDFEQFNLIAIRRLPWIFPNQNPLAIAQPVARSIPAHKFVRPSTRTLLEKRPDFPVATQDASVPFEDRWHQRRFENGISRIKSKQSLSVE